MYFCQYLTIYYIGVVTYINLIKKKGEMLMKDLGDLKYDNIVELTFGKVICDEYDLAKLPASAQKVTFTSGRIGMFICSKPRPRLISLTAPNCVTKEIFVDSLDCLPNLKSDYFTIK